MNVVVALPNKSKLAAYTSSRYAVVIQYKDRRKRREYIKCETFAKVRAAIKLYRQMSSVSYIYYNIPDEEHIEAYDARDPTRYA
jgi:hypothetical protein